MRRLNFLSIILPIWAAISMALFGSFYLFFKVWYWLVG